MAPLRFRAAIDILPAGSTSQGEFASSPPRPWLQIFREIKSTGQAFRSLTGVPSEARNVPCCRFASPAASMPLSGTVQSLGRTPLTGLCMRGKARQPLQLSYRVCISPILRNAGWVNWTALVSTPLEGLARLQTGIL